jgi:predicted RNA binding protein YcfA (HicA-like mRNA interferase family)
VPHSVPLTYKDVETGLKNLGFVLQPQKASGHEQWEKELQSTKFKVTVSKHLAPFSIRLVGYMARQAGVSKKEFYKACGK